MRHEAREIARDGRLVLPDAEPARRITDDPDAQNRMVLAGHGQRCIALPDRAFLAVGAGSGSRRAFAADKGLRIEGWGEPKTDLDTVREALDAARTRLQVEENPGPQMVISSNGSVIIQLDPEEPCFNL